MNTNTKLFLISLSLSTICSLNVNGMNVFSQHRILSSGRNSRQYEREFESCIERCEDRRDECEEGEDNRPAKRTIELDFDSCEERCEETLIIDERRDLVEADLDLLSIHHLDSDGSVINEYAHLRDERDDEVEIKHRIEYGKQTFLDDCKVAIKQMLKDILIIPDIDFALM